ncbi:plasmid pRiA4b ORF-3 family protein [Ruminococcus turbiniformis]
MMLKSVLRFVFDNIGSPLSSKKIADTMTSDGRKIDTKTVGKIDSSEVDFVASDGKTHLVLQSSPVLESYQKAAGKDVSKMPGYVFKIMLEDSHPPVWRRVLVPEKITFYDLHRVIQTVFGWDDEHLHSFSIPSQRIQIGQNDDDWSEYDYEETETLLEQFILGQKSFRYTYDFGDDWIHKITFEKEDPEYSGRSPVLLKVKGDNFEEDTGGVWFGDTPENRRPLDAEKVKDKLRRMNFPRRDDLAAKLEDLNALQAKLQDTLKKVEDFFSQDLESMRTEQLQKAHEISPMAEKVNAWKKFADRAGAKTLKCVRGSRTNEQLLLDLSEQELKDYCKYLQIPVVYSWGKEKLAGTLANTFREHPEYLMYVFFEDEWKELKYLRNLNRKEIKFSGKDLDTVIKALALGIMHVNIPDETEGAAAVLELAADGENLFPAVTPKETRERYRHIRSLSDKLGEMILSYGMIEIHSMHTLFCKINQENPEEADFFRFLYWHARFNNMLQTVYLADGTCFAVMDGLDPRRIFQDMTKYSEGMDYRIFTQNELYANAKTPLYVYPELESLYSSLTGSLRLPVPFAEELLTDISHGIMDGCTLKEIFDSISALNLDEKPLDLTCELWEAVSGVMLVFPVPMLKGRSRTEYAAIKKISPWDIRMADDAAFENTSALRMCK